MNLIFKLVIILFDFIQLSQFYYINDQVKLSKIRFCLNLFHFHLVILIFIRNYKETYCTLNDKMDNFYFTIIETNLTKYCKIELTRYWPNATIQIDYKDGTNEVINLIEKSKDDIGCLIQNDFNITENSTGLSSKLKQKYDFYTSLNYDSITTMTITNATSTTTGIDTSLITSKYTDTTNDLTSSIETSMITENGNETTYFENTSSYSTSFSSQQEETSTYASTQKLTTQQTTVKNNNNNYKVESYYLTGILFQNIKFDDIYWLRSFSFESSKSGIINIKVS